MKNSVQIQGRLTRDPHFALVDGKKGPVPFLRFGLAVARKPPHASGTDFFEVYVYGRDALLIHPFLKKGSEVLVDGWLRTRQGEKVMRTEVVANEVTFLRGIAWDKGRAAKKRLHEQEQKMGIDGSPLPLAPVGV